MQGVNTKVFKPFHRSISSAPSLYTTTKPAENPSKLSSQIFLFLKLCHRDFSQQSNVKNHDFIKKLIQFSIFSGHPLLYLIKST